MSLRRGIVYRPFSSFMPRRQYLRPTVQVGLDLDRAQLHARLHRRVEDMVARQRRTSAPPTTGKTPARRIPVEPLTPAGFAPFGTVIENPVRTGSLQPNGGLQTVPANQGKDKSNSAAAAGVEAGEQSYRQFLPHVQP